VPTQTIFSNQIAESCLLEHILNFGPKGLPQLPPEAFTDEVHCILYSALSAAQKNGRLLSLATINDNLAQSATFLPKLQEIAKERKLSPDAWTDFVFQLQAAPRSLELVNGLAVEVADAHRKRQQAEIARSMQDGSISLSASIEKLQKLTAGLPVPPKFVDFAPILASGLQREVPTLAQCMPDKFFLYSGRINEIHGEPATGKTNIALSIAIAVLRDGGSVVFIDPEDNPTGIACRYLGLGGNPSDLVSGHWHYLHNPEGTEFPGLIEWVKANKPALVVHDGVAEGLAAEGYDENSSRDVLAWFRERIRPFADAGAGVLISDHVTKNSETRGRYSRGSGAKLGRYDGVSYEAQVITPYKPGVAGAVRLVVAKDRNGGVGSIKEVVAEIHFTPNGDTTDVQFRRPETSGAFRPTVIIGRILDCLAANPNSGLRDLRKLGKADYVDAAIQILVQEGTLKVGKVGGKNKYEVINETITAPETGSNEPPCEIIKEAILAFDIDENEPF